MYPHSKFAKACLVGGTEPGTCTYISKVGHISVLQFEKLPLFTDFQALKHTYFYENANFLGPKSNPYFF